MASARTKILGHVAHPTHILWVPQGLTLINFLGWLGALVFSKDYLFGLPILMCLAGFVLTHLWLAWRFQREVHIERVWYVRWFRSRRRPFGLPGQGLIPRPGSNYAEG